MVRWQEGHLTSKNLHYCPNFQTWNNWRGKCQLETNELSFSQNLGIKPVSSCAFLHAGDRPVTQPKLTKHTQPFYGPFSGTTQVSQCWKKASSGRYGARWDIRGRHTNNPAGHHSIQTNQWSTSLISPFFMPDALPAATFEFILAWDRHQICWLAYPAVFFSSGVLF